MKYAVYAQYEISGYEKNEIISVHESYERAERAARGSMLAIAEVPDPAKKGDNLRALQIEAGL